MTPGSAALPGPGSVPFNAGFSDLDWQCSITQVTQLLCTYQFPIFKVEVAHCPALRVWMMH